MDGESVRANQEAAGIPDSRPFITSEEERVPSGVDKILRCHINGVPISQLNLPPEVLAALDYYATDEGVREKNARPQTREPSGVELGDDAWNKALQQRKDDVKQRDLNSYDARDPFLEVAKEYAQPGMRPKFLSEKTARDGDNRDYTIVTKPNGDPVKVRGMILGLIPEELAVAKMKHYQRRGGEMLKQLDQKYKQEGGSTAVSDQDSKDLDSR